MNKKTHFGYKEVNESEKSKYVGEVFTSVAENYDVMNDAMSFGMHRLWKKILVELAGINSKDYILDIASGTGDISKLISREYPETSLFMSDINYEMLNQGRNRAIDESFNQNCCFCQLSGEVLPFKNNTFDIITVGFGLRNFTNVQKSLVEIKRVLKKKGKFYCLEFSEINNKSLRKIFDLYSKLIPLYGKLILNNEEAYSYLIQSIKEFPNQIQLTKKLLKAGFRKIEVFDVLDGIASIHISEI